MRRKIEAYLDNSATTPASEAVKDIVVRTMTEDFGNPSSQHMKGIGAERYVRQARERIASTLKVDPGEIFFTSGGTESDNWAIFGSALANRRAGNHIITTVIEHDAVQKPFLALEKLGYRVSRLRVDSNGFISVRELIDVIDEETILVSIMFVNNEIGTVEPIEESAKAIISYNRLRNKEILFHVDAVQGYGKFHIFPKNMGIDMLSVSGHKIHGPKGSGFLYIREKAKIKPLILGGGQQHGMRSGTDNVPGDAGLGVAAMEAYDGFETKVLHMRLLKKRLIEGLKGIEGTHFNSQESEVASAPHIVSCAFEGLRSEVLLHALEERGIYVSSGSACSSNKRDHSSGVLREIGLRRELRDATIRFSLSDWTTSEEIDYTLSSLNEIVPVLRRYSRV